MSLEHRACCRSTTISGMIQACGPSFRPAQSPSSSRTSKAQRRCWQNSAQRLTRTPSPRTEHRYARHVPATGGSRSTRRETLCRVPYSARRTRRLGLHGASGTRRANPCPRRRPHGDAARRRGGLCRPRRPSCGSAPLRATGAGARVSSDRVARRHRADRPGRAPVQGSRCRSVSSSSATESSPLKSLYRTNLPIPATAFLGRKRELREVVEFVNRNDARLVTPTGPGERERRAHPPRPPPKLRRISRRRALDPVGAGAGRDCGRGDVCAGVGGSRHAGYRDRNVDRLGVRHQAVADRRRQLRAPGRGSCRACRSAGWRLPEGRCRRLQS